MKKQDKILIVLGTAAIIAVSGVVGYTLFATPDQKTATTPTSQVQSSSSTAAATPTTSDASTSAMTATPSSSSSTYKDGAYTANTTYRVPHGEQNSLSATIVVSSGKISSVKTNNNYNDHESAQYISWFEQEISSTVTGQPLGDISVSRVGGASLTSSAFNDVLDTVRSQAKA